MKLEPRDALRAAELKDRLHAIATNDAASGMAQIRAATEWLNRHEGLPIARNFNVNVNEVANLTDDELNAELARHATVAALVDLGGAPVDEAEA